MKKWLREGRGQGHQGDFKPWYTVRDVPSQGLSTRIKDLITGRVHHLLSRKELWVYLIFSFNPRIVDIREQFPLPLNETLEIAGRLGIRHPMDPSTKEHVVMTTDFLLDIFANGETILIARTVKMRKHLKSRRTVEKLEIERTYWTERGINWAIITEDEIPLTVAKNIKWIYFSFDISDLPGISEALVLNLEKYLHDKIIDCNKPFAHIATEVDNLFSLPAGFCLRLIKHFIVRHIWQVDMTIPLNGNKPLPLFDSKPLRTLGNVNDN